MTPDEITFARETAIVTIRAMTRWGIPCGESSLPQVTLRLCNALERLQRKTIADFEKEFQAEIQRTLREVSAQMRAGIDESIQRLRDAFAAEDPSKTYSGDEMRDAVIQFLIELRSKFDEAPNPPAAPPP